MWIINKSPSIMSIIGGDSSSVGCWISNACRVGNSEGHVRASFLVLLTAKGLFPKEDNNKHLFIDKEMSIHMYIVLSPPNILPKLPQKDVAGIHKYDVAPHRIIKCIPNGEVNQIPLHHMYVIPLIQPCQSICVEAQLLH